MKKAWIFGFVAVAVTALSAASFAAGSGTPPGVTVASQLGVGLDELVACTNSARGEATQQPGTDAAKTERQALVLACLQSDHPEITATQLTDALSQAHAGR